MPQATARIKYTVAYLEILTCYYKNQATKIICTVCNDKVNNDRILFYCVNYPFRVKIVYIVQITYCIYFCTLFISQVLFYATEWYFILCTCMFSAISNLSLRRHT